MKKKLKYRNRIICVFFLKKKLKDQSVYFLKFLARHHCLAPFSFQFLFFQFHYCLRNQKQLTLNYDQIA